MKTISFEVEFLRPALANGTKNEPVSRFTRTKSGKIIFKDAWWHSAIGSALSCTPEARGVRPGDILVDPEVDAETSVYARVFNGDKHRLHEAINVGTVVQFAAAIPDDMDEAVFRTLMARLGKFIGISPFGYRLGYGKFKLI